MNGKIMLGMALAALAPLAGVADEYASVADKARNTLRYCATTNRLFGKIALEGTGCASLIRVRCEDFNHVKPILDIGVDGIIFPQISGYDAAVKAGTPEVQKILDDVAARTRKAGKLFFNIGSYESAVRRGAAFCCGGGDIEAMSAAWKNWMKD